MDFSSKCLHIRGFGLGLGLPFGLELGLVLKNSYIVSGLRLVRSFILIVHFSLRCFLASTFPSFFPLSSVHSAFYPSRTLHDTFSMPFHLFPIFAFPVPMKWSFDYSVLSFDVAVVVVVVVVAAVVADVSCVPL